MRALTALAALVLIAGCDAFSGGGPAWAEAGAVAAFDYTPGPDSLWAFGPGNEPPYRRAAAADRAVVMRIDAGESHEPADRRVTWGEPSDGSRSRFVSDVRFPLDHASIEVKGDGLRIVRHTGCGGGLIGGTRGTTSVLRVPKVTGLLQEVGDCPTGPGRTLESARFETVTVPAGTFEVVVIEDPHYDQVEYWSWDAGLVRLDVFNGEGALRGRFVRSAGE